MLCTEHGDQCVLFNIRGKVNIEFRSKTLALKGAKVDTCLPYSSISEIAVSRTDCSSAAISMYASLN